MSQVDVGQQAATFIEARCDDRISAGSYGALEFGDRVLQALG
jgi:hypothetical protein